MCGRRAACRLVCRRDIRRLPARPASNRLGHARELMSLGSRALGANRLTPLSESPTNMTNDLYCYRIEGETRKAKRRETKK